MLTIVYAPAHNELNLIVTAFSTYESAVEFLRDVFGHATVYTETVKDGKRTFEIGNNATLRWAIAVGVEPHQYLWCDDITEEQADKLFTYYYGGCGECYSIIAQEIDDGEVPLFPFDQD